MYYVLRDTAGQVCSLHRDPVVGAQVLPAEHPDARAFLGETSKAQLFATLAARFLRVPEDQIDALIRRNLLCIIDLPMVAQLTLFDRKHFRVALALYRLQPSSAGSRGMDGTVVMADWK